MARIQISNRIEGATLLMHETSRRFTGAWVRALNATARTLVRRPRCRQRPRGGLSPRPDGRRDNL